MLIVRVPRDGAVVARIRAELEANDFWVREIGPDAASARTPLPLLAGNATARAALRMQSAGAAIELWVASEGGASGGGEVVRLPDAERDDALLAVRATEAMRARGLKLPKRSAPSGGAAVSGGGSTAVSGGVPSTTSTESAEAERARKQAEEQARAQAEAQRQAEAQKQAEAQRQAEAEAAAAEAQRRAQAEREAEEERAEAEREAEAQRQAEAEAEEAESEQDARSPASPALLYIELGPAIAASPDDVSATGAGFLNLRVQPSATWSISGFAFVPFIGGEFEKPTGPNAGRGRIRSYMLGGMLDLHAMLPELEISAGAGAAFLLSHITADPIDPMLTRQDQENELTSAVLARAAMHVEVAPRVRIGLRVIFGLALPELTVDFADEPVAHWGRPFVLGALTLDWGVL